MQIKYLHRSIYALANYALSQEKCDELRQRIETPVKNWEFFKKEGLLDKACQKATGISRSTYYRYKRTLYQLSKGIPPLSKRPRHVRTKKWGESEMQAVLQVRRENPTYGKAKIAVILKRDHEFKISESTVGRILSYLKDKGLVQKSLSSSKQKRKRQFKTGHAQPCTFKKYEDIKRGERVQIDHMSVHINGITVKHFQSWERTSKHIHAHVSSRANSSSAKRFLLDLIEKAPYKINSIQVDGGSEFMAYFEEACEDLKIPLLVLPPRSPQQNGGVERGNRTFREEFYAKRDLLADSVGALNAELKKALHKYNAFRPHQALNMLTPLEYIKNTYLEAA